MPTEDCGSHALLNATIGSLQEAGMRTVTASEARQQLTALLEAVEAGDEVTITRRGRPVARLVPVAAGMNSFPDRSELRDSMPAMKSSSAETIRELREDSRY